MSAVAYRYRAVDRAGARRRGVIEATDRHDAYRRLAAGGLRPVHLAATRGGARARGKVTLKEVAHLTYQLAVLMQARISIVDGLRSIADQEPNERLRATLEDVATRIASGSNVVEALTPHRAIFGDIYIQTVRAAEVSGNMIEVLDKLAEMLDRRYEMNKAVKGALMYPICVVGALCLAVVFLLVFVVPEFTAMFEGRGLELPLPTQILVGFSGFIRGWWFAILPGLVAAGWGIRRAWRNPAWRDRIDDGLHRVPFLRDLLRGFAVSRFAHVFGLTIRSGLGLIEALEIAGRASGRPLLLRDCETMQEQVKHGGRLSDVMQQCGYLPGFARRLFTAGEEASDLGRMSEIVARHYDREVTHLTKNLTTVIEPIMIVGLAGIVLIIALAIFLPMWNMAALIG